MPVAVFFLAELTSSSRYLRKPSDGSGRFTWECELFPFSYCCLQIFVLALFHLLLYFCQIILYWTHIIYSIKNCGAKFDLFDLRLYISQKHKWLGRFWASQLFCLDVVKIKKKFTCSNSCCCWRRTSSLRWPFIPEKFFSTNSLTRAIPTIMGDFRFPL